MSQTPFCSEAGCTRCVEDKAQCKENCLRQLAHHKRCIHCESRLLSEAEIAEVQALYDAYYTRHEQILQSK